MSTEQGHAAEMHSQRVRVLGCPVDVVDMDQAVRRLVTMVNAARDGERTGSGLVVTLNPEMVMLARTDSHFRQAVEQASLLVPDGIGVVRALRRRGHPGAARVGGADLLALYLPHAVKHGHRIALAGAAPGVAAEAARRLVRRHPGLQVVATDSGAPDASLAARLRAARAEMIWAAYGHGRQELFLQRHLAATGAAVGIGVGGTLDYLSGRTRRAPAGVQRAGLEWAWRLATQPWRLGRQMVLPRFWMLERAEAARLRRAAR